MKVKLTRQQEFVIGGYTLSEGNRKYLEEQNEGQVKNLCLRFELAIPLNLRLSPVHHATHDLIDLGFGKLLGNNALALIRRPVSLPS